MFCGSLETTEYRLLLLSWMQVASIDKKHHTSGKNKLRSVLQKEARFVAIMIDAWTSKSVKSLILIFSTYPVHFIDDEWSLQSYVLTTRLFDGKRTTENVKEFLYSGEGIFILEKISCVVHDGAAT